ncbi:MAG TPA: hypothetical protein PLU30_17565 [Verrucomicrobiae bacterium]|nr:hypothetical protein [Verrucomicrobiae bacterium]
MNENHRHHILITFRYIDDLLAEAQRLVSAADDGSLFETYLRDAQDADRRTILEQIRRTRETMGRILRDLKIVPDRPASGSLWAAQGCLTFAAIAVAELEPGRMRGYGSLSDEDARVFEVIVSELGSALRPTSDPT